MTGDLHLASTFASAEREFPDLMEKYVVLLVDAETSTDRIAIMRRGLRETICARYPMAEAREVVAVEHDAQGALGL